MSAGDDERLIEPLVIISSAGAGAYKLDADLGTLEPGKIADLVILDADPLDSARNYRRIFAVVKDGRRVDLAALPVAPVISAIKVEK